MWTQRMQADLGGEEAGCPGEGACCRESETSRYVLGTGGTGVCANTNRDDPVESSRGETRHMDGITLLGRWKGEQCREPTHWQH